MALSPTERFYKSNWVEYHCNHCFMIKDSKPNTLLLGASIVAGLSRYLNVWNEYFAQINTLSLGIGEDRIKNYLWLAINLPLPLSMKNVILCGANDIPIDTPHDIADYIISIGSILQKKSSGINVSICGLVPRDEGWSVNRVLINEVDEILKHQCNINGFAFIFQDHGWTFANGSLDCSLFYKDMLHLIEKGNVKLAKSIILSITSRYNHINLSSTNSITSYRDITRQKVQSTISFLLNEHDFPPLSNACQPILSNVSESRLYQRKPASNVKLGNVYVSPVYASSVSELVKPLNNSKPVCSSNATQRNVCNACSVSQLIKPLNVSKPVCSSKETKRNVCNANSVGQFTKTLNVSKPLCSSKATKRNVCNAGSVSKLIKPLNVCKTVCSNNTTRLNVCKVSSVSQLVKPSTVSKPVLSNNVCNVRNVSCYSQLLKTFNVTKSVCSSNASISVICNSTCKPVSDFVSDCQLVKPARKLKGVKPKRPHERLANNKNSHQHNFTKSFSAVNILMMSIYFYELGLLFFIFHHNFCNNNVDNFFKGYVRCNNFSANDFLSSDSVAIFNIPNKYISTSSIRFYHFIFSFYEYSFFINSVFYNILNVNSVTNILNNDFYITYLFDRDNRFLFCNYKVTRECINIFHQRKNKSNMSKNSIASDNSAFFLVIFFALFRFFNRKRRKYLKLCYLAMFLIVIFLLKLQIKNEIPSNFTPLQKCSTNEFFNLETITSCHYIQHIILHRNLVCLAISNLKYRNYNRFYHFLLLLSGDVSLNPGPVQISPSVNVNIWEPFNKTGLHFLHININSLLPKIDELKCIANKTKAAIIGITESKLDHT